MYITNVHRSAGTNKILFAGIKIYELLKLAIQPRSYKENNSKEYLPYILNAVIKGYTVLDIGSHKRAYFLDLFKLSKHHGRLITFETNSGMYNYLQKMKLLLNLQNVFIEPMLRTNAHKQPNISNPSGNRNGSDKTSVININGVANRDDKETANLQTVDDYCSGHFIVPALIKFKLERNELNVLFGSTIVLKKYKPQVLIECSEGLVNRATLVAAFTFLTNLHYSGYFILDTMKVPLASFDFNTYQNEVLGYYCNHFIFE